MATGGVANLLGATVIAKGGEEVAVSSFDTEDYIVGIYFSAHWCPPCRGFTPMLAETYKKITAAGKKFEIVFASSDRDQGSFDEYFAEMPWKAIPFGNDKKEELGAKYGVRGIPTLVLIKGGSGETITTEGRAKVQNDPEGANFPGSWA